MMLGGRIRLLVRSWLYSLLMVSYATAADRPNILFVLSEDQGTHAGYLGTPGLETANIDALAASGVQFRNAFVAYPVCSASKAAFYTGLHNHTNGILNNTHNYHKPDQDVTPEERGRRLAQANRILDRYSTLTELLHRDGYYQGVTHKLHVLPNSKFPYDEFLHGSQEDIAGFLGRAAAKDRPWFLLVNIPYSHRPYPNSDKTPIGIDPAGVELPAFLPDSDEVRKDWSEYLAGIQKVDDVLGQTLASLAQSGQTDETIVIYMSDHGPTYPHGKMTLHDLGLRVPLLVSGPGVAKGKLSNALVSELDLFPTILELCGIEPALSYPLHGRSMTKLLQEPGSKGSR